MSKLLVSRLEMGKESRFRWIFVLKKDPLAIKYRSLYEMANLTDAFINESKKKEGGNSLWN